MSREKHSLDDLRIDRSARPRGRAPVGLALILFLAVAAFAGVKWYYDQPAPVTVRTHLVRETSTGGERTLLNGSGYVTARREATVSSKVTGKVLDVLVEEGMAVEEGQLLARIDASNTERSFQLAEAQAAAARESLDETRVQMAQAERDLRRFTELAAQGIGSASDVDRAETDVKAFKAQLDRQVADITVADREIALWRQQIEDYTIRAPFSGVVTAKNAQPGEMISLMSGGGGFARTGICTIVDMKSLEIEVDVSESYIKRVSPGQPVEATLDAYPDWKIPAKVIAIIPTADRQKATVKVRVAFDALDPRILPEMSVKVAFQSVEEEKPVERVLSIPTAAVHQRDGRDYVWILSGGRVAERPVTLGETGGENVVVTAGVAGGERLVVDGPENLADGASVMEAS